MNLETPFLRLAYISSTQTLISCFLPSPMQRSGAGTSKQIPLHESGLSLPSKLIILSFFTFPTQLLNQKTIYFLFLQFNMVSNISIDSVDSDVFFKEKISNEPSPQRHNSQNILNSTEISQSHAAGMPSVSSIASPEPRILTVDDDSNEPTMPYGFGRQLPIVPPS